MYIKRRKEAAAYKTRPSMPRAGASARATGDAGGVAGGKERSTEAQTNNCEWPANGPASRRLLISVSVFNFREDEDWASKMGKIPPVTTTQIA